MSKRTDSSKALREDLNRLHVDNHVPEVDSKIIISKYFEHAALSYKSALNSYEKRDWTYSYVQFKIFLSFCVKLRKHASFKTSPDIKAKNWIVTAIDAAFNILEYIIIELDKIEDDNVQRRDYHKIKNEERTEEELLNDEFDCLIDEFDGPDLNASISLSVQPSAPPLGLLTSTPLSKPILDGSIIIPQPQDNKLSECGGGLLNIHDADDSTKKNHNSTRVINIAMPEEVLIPM